MSIQNASLSAVTIIWTDTNGPTALGAQVSATTLVEFQIEVTDPNQVKTWNALFPALEAEAVIGAWQNFTAQLFRGSTAKLLIVTCGLVLGGAIYRGYTVQYQSTGTGVSFKLTPPPR